MILMAEINLNGWHHSSRNENSENLFFFSPNFFVKSEPLIFYDLPSFYSYSYLKKKKKNRGLTNGLIIRDLAKFLLIEFYIKLWKFKEKKIFYIDPTAFEHFEEKHQELKEGENDSPICSLNRKWE